MSTIPARGGLVALLFALTAACRPAMLLAAAIPTVALAGEGGTATNAG